MGELDQESSDNDQHDTHTTAKKKKKLTKYRTKVSAIQ